jgi:hypothetical protein
VDVLGRSGHEDSDDAGDDHLDVRVVVECPVCDRTSGDLASASTIEELIENLGRQVAEV